MSKLDGNFRHVIILSVMEWFYSKNGAQLGPVSREDLLQKKIRGEVLPSDLVWKQGMDDWKPLAQVAELAGGPPPSMSSYPPVNMQGFAPQIPNYLWQSIAVTLLCCVPFGVVSIIYATKVDGLVARGDIAGAMAASKNARLWVNLSVGSFLIIIVLAVLGGLLENA